MGLRVAARGVHAAVVHDCEVVWISPACAAQPRSKALFQAITDLLHAGSNIWPVSNRLHVNRVSIVEIRGGLQDIQYISLCVVLSLLQSTCGQESVLLKLH